MFSMLFAMSSSFRSHPLLRSGHAQTLAGVWLAHEEPLRGSTRQHRLPLADGDAIVLHENEGDRWQAGDRAALLIHGLAGCSQSGYMLRTAARLNRQGVRTFRMDMRGCGEAFGHARLPAHSDRAADTLAALRKIDELCPGSPVTAVGFSLGGNLLLNTLAAIGVEATSIDMAVAVCPPIDLLSCAERLRAGRWRIYDRHFIAALLKMVGERRRKFPDLPPIEFARRPRTLWDFDDAVTAPMSGYASAEEYYQGTAPAPRLANIRVPTLILAAENDPLVPAQMFAEARRSDRVSLHMTRGGGHLGFIARRGSDPDRRWLDWRLVEWTLAAGIRGEGCSIPAR